MHRLSSRNHRACSPRVMQLQECTVDFRLSLRHQPCLMRLPAGIRSGLQKDSFELLGNLTLREYKVLRNSAPFRKGAPEGKYGELRHRHRPAGWGIVIDLEEEEYGKASTNSVIHAHGHSGVLGFVCEAVKQIFLIICEQGNEPILRFLPTSINNGY